MEFNLLSQEYNKQSIEHSVSINAILSQSNRRIQSEKQKNPPEYFEALPSLICTKV